MKWYLGDLEEQASESFQGDMLSSWNDLGEKLSGFEKGAAAINALYNDGKLKDADFAFISEFALSYEILKTDFTLVESFAYGYQKEGEAGTKPLLHFIIQAIKYTKSLSQYGFNY